MIATCADGADAIEVLESEPVTLPERFRAAGYRTAGAGKIFHHTDGFNPPDQWDEYFDQVFDDPWDRGNYRRVRTGPKPTNHPLNGIRPYEHEFDWGVLDRPDATYGDVLAADSSVGRGSRTTKADFRHADRIVGVSGRDLQDLERCHVSSGTAHRDRHGEAV